MLERIQKILSAAGVCSRREAEELILEGKVRVNGRVVSELGQKADAEEDVIKVGNRVVGRSTGDRKIYLLLNKPKGYVTTTKDPQGRKTVMDLLGKTGLFGGSRVYPVGRLDYDSEGLLLLTNDGDFANAVMHPSKEVLKTYEVKVKGVIDDAGLKRLAGGVRLADGLTAPAKVFKRKLTESNSWIEITIHEGRNRQVRRMCETLGHPVQKLKRTKIGPVGMGAMPAGGYRELTPLEVKALLKAAGKIEGKSTSIKTA
ncbi:MAG: pseudouridine synthase [Nitrospirota bacterium]